MDKKEQAITLLREKQELLLQNGITRLPQRSDFTAEEVQCIKAQFGPFPRALEAAGLKEPRCDDRSQRQLEKRIAAKRRRTAAKIAAAASKTDTMDSQETKSEKECLK